MRGMHQDGVSAAPSRATPMSLRLREATRELHTKAERSGFVQEMLRGRSTRNAYALFTRNLLPAYQAMEEGLVRWGSSSALGPLAHEPVFRSAAIEADLDSLTDGSWRESLPVLPAAARYMDQIRDAADHGQGERLVAHAYVRYLGDLNGGQVLKRLLAKVPGLDGSMLSFYDFPQIEDLGVLRTRYRAWIDAAGEDVEDADGVVAEAARAFELNIAISEAVLLETEGRRVPA